MKPTTVLLLSVPMLLGGCAGETHEALRPRSAGSVLARTNTELEECLVEVDRLHNRRDMLQVVVLKKNSEVQDIQAWIAVLQEDLAEVSARR